MTRFLAAKAVTEKSHPSPIERLTKAVHVTVAQMKNISTSPITLVPAPGPGFALLLLRVIISGPGGVGFNFGAEVGVVYEGGSEVLETTVQSATGYATPFRIAGLPASDGREFLENRAFILKASGDDATEGDYPIDIVLEYKVIPV